MSLQYLTRKTALTATTKNPLTTNFNHLRSFPRAWLNRRTKHDPKLKSVRPADRIKWWNIVPGDQICLRGDTEGTVHEVLSINRLSNRVFLKNTSSPSKDSAAPQTKNYHYSRCQLYVGEYRLPPKDDPTGALVQQPVFASRIGTSQPKWDYSRKRWVWRRYAISTVPKFPHLSGKIRIPWPDKAKKKHPEASLYDTPLDEVAKITYELPYFEPKLNVASALPEAAAETEYLDLIYNPHLGTQYDPSAPFELYLKLELANPHSRAKKLQRWKAWQAGTHVLLRTIAHDELKSLGGRSVRQAKADAAFKWRELVKEEQTKKKKARWMHTAQMVKWQNKAAKKAKKDERQRRRLTELVLQDVPNQIVPPVLKERHRATT
ncbi:unnamed protein product [Cyclocybe aegerita]|uniref:Uncharacterized protein n=1 Tax=Cyclocybe aegerita TaxID=1973307 RepID=A0A8S0W2X2_CYCAE|nr:unnamed protein product [Cyclocybe aegerita]